MAEAPRAGETHKQRSPGKRWRIGQESAPGRERPGRRGGDVTRVIIPGDGGRRVGNGRAGEVQAGEPVGPEPGAAAGPGGRGRGEGASVESHPRLVLT